jgi:hypothetical protein
MPAGPHPADSLNHFQPDLGIPYDSISSGSALEIVVITPSNCKSTNCTGNYHTKNWIVYNF